MLILEIMAAYDLIIGAGHVPYDLEIHCFTCCFYLPTNEISTNGGSVSGFYGPPYDCFPHFHICLCHMHDYALYT